MEKVISLNVHSAGGFKKKETQRKQCGTKYFSLMVVQDSDGSAVITQQVAHHYQFQYISCACIAYVM